MRTIKFPEWYADYLTTAGIDAEVVSYAQLLFESIQKFLSYTDTLPIEWHKVESNNFGVMRRIIPANQQDIIVLKYIHSYLAFKESYNVNFPTIFS